MQKHFFQKVAAALLFFATASCNGQSAKKTVAFGKGQYTSDLITGISISHSHMTRYSMKSFELREINGETVFSCHYFDGEGEEVKHENVSVSPEYMQRLREIAKKYDIARLKENKTSNRPFVHDAPTCSMTMYWTDKQSLRLNYWAGNGEFEKLFEEIKIMINDK